MVKPVDRSNSNQTRSDFWSGNANATSKKIKSIITDSSMKSKNMQEGSKKSSKAGKATLAAIKVTEGDQQTRSILSLANLKVTPEKRAEQFVELKPLDLAGALQFMVEKRARVSMY